MRFLAPTFLLAHAFGKRYELPIPLGLFVVAGAGIVLLSFFLVLRRQVHFRASTPAQDTIPHRPLSAPWAIVSLVGWAALVLIGYFGSQEIPENILPTLFWVIVWVGVALSCGLFGDWTQALNPFANLAKLADRQALRKLVLGRKAPLVWPRWLGWWPAVILYFAMVACELIFNQTMTLPRPMAEALGIYGLLSAFMGLVFGPSWTDRGEVFTVLFNTWGRLGWFRFGSPGRKGFLGGLDAGFSSEPSRLAFIILLLASVSFDGFLSTPLWTRIEHLFLSAPLQGQPATELLQLVTFIALELLLWSFFMGFAVLVDRTAGRSLNPGQALAGLLPSLLPISFGYLMAHYLQYLLINGQLMFPLLGNPTGDSSWPLHLPYPFNDSFEPNVHILPTSAAWYVAVAVIVIVHILAVFVAHSHLGSSAKDPDVAKRSEYPWIAAMVAYTMLSLWLLAQPLVKDTPPPAHHATSLELHIQPTLPA